MSKPWQLQVAKSKFSELVNQARTDGPQIVTRRGEAVVVVIAVEEWRRLRPTRSFHEILMSAPIEELASGRTDDVGREVDPGGWA